MVTTTEYAQLSASAYDSGGVGDVNANWIRTDYTNLSDGFSASTYENTSTGEVVVAYRGTNSILDAAADVESAIGIASSQYSDAANYYNNIAAQYGSENISVTGHSLGGALASGSVATLPQSG
jgi:pimeloyl-ACP methyl ester carboxylesterase